MIKVKDIFDYINSFAPFDTQCQWDNSGLLIGDADKEVKKIGFALDMTKEVLLDAVNNQVDLIVTHHPVIFTPQKAFLKGDIAYELALNGISVISAHTSFDCAKGGVNDVLCELFGLINIEGVESEECAVAMARIGELPFSDELTSLQLGKLVAQKLDTSPKVVVSDKPVRKVALCGGAGMDFFVDAVKMGADAYITGEAKHHELLMAQDMGITLIEAGHFETENPSVEYLRTYVQKQFSQTKTIILKQTRPAVTID